MFWSQTNAGHTTRSAARFSQTRIPEVSSLGGRRRWRQHQQAACRRQPMTRKTTAEPLRFADPPPPQPSSALSPNARRHRGDAAWADHRHAVPAEPQCATSSTTACAQDDHGYIWRTGLLMLAITLMQVVFSVGAVYFGSRTAMGFGRDVRQQPVPPSHRLLRTRGQPLRRTIVDHPHHQRRATGADARRHGQHHAGRRAAHDDRRRLHGVARGRRAVGDAARERAALVDRVSAASSCAWCRSSARCRCASIRSTESCASRSSVSESCGHSSASPTRSTVSPGPTMSSPPRHCALGASCHACSRPSCSCSTPRWSAAVWLGADRIGNGQMQIGALVAFLSYLVQILMSVMMATFVVMMIPRASVCADRISEVSTPKPRSCPRRSRLREVTARGLLELRHVGFHYPGAEDAGVERHLAHRPGRPDHRDHRQHRLGQDHIVASHAPTLRRHLGHGTRRRCRRTRARARGAVETHRTRAAAALPVLRHRRQQPALRRSRRHRRRAVAGAGDRPSGRLRAGDDGRVSNTHQPRRHQRLGRAAAASRNRAGVGAQARDLSLRRFVLRARSRDRRTVAGRARTAHRRRRRADRRAAGFDDLERRPDPRARRRAHGGAGHARRTPRDSCPTYAEIVASQITEEDAA